MELQPSTSTAGGTGARDDGSFGSSDDGVPFKTGSDSSSAAVPLAKKIGGSRVSQLKAPACCPVCKKTFHSKDYLRLHMGMHSGEKTYSCETCGKSFWNFSAFKYHQKSRDYQNGVCPGVKKRGLGEWRPKGAWTCKTCGKRMKNAGSYNDHMKRHRGDKRFKCGDCGKAFVSSSDLAEHRKIHSGVWQFSCLFCERGFHLKVNLLSEI